MNNQIVNLYKGDQTNIPIYHYERAGGIVTYQFIFSICATDEPLDKIGITHFLERLIIERFKHVFINQDSLFDYILDRGGKFDGLTFADYVVVKIIIADKENSQLILSALCKIFSEFTLVPSIVEKERLAIKSEIKRKALSADQQLYWQVYKTLYKNSGYAYFRVGTELTIDNITTEDLFSFYKKYFNGSRQIIIIAGDISEGECRNIFDSITPCISCNLQSKLPESYTVAETQFPYPRVFKHEYFSKELHIALAWPTIPQTEKDSAVLYFISQLLSGVRGSILYKKLRYENGLVYSVQAYSVQFAKAGNFMITTSCSPDVVQQVLAIVDDTMEFLANNPVNSDIISNLARHIRSKGIFAEETIDSLIHRDINALLYPPTPTHAELLNEVDAITPDDIQRVASKYLNNQNLFKFFVGSSEILEKYS